MTPEQVQAKLLHLAEAIAKLRAMPQGSLDEFRAIQVLIDVGGHVVSRLGLGAPDSSHDILERLERIGRVPPGSAVRFGRMVAFRNRIVHLYDRVDDEYVYEIVTRHLDDLDALATLYIDALQSLSP
jgi:uncharacterized protein YutE (UPF0331/DUF86 family)